MPPKPQKRDAFELFQSHFDQLLNPAHELVQLAQKIDWDRFEAAFAGGYSPDLGAPAKATRLMVGLQYLKYTFNESDESVVDRWVENPYWQYFCGYTHLQHKCPIHPTSMTRWRKRVGGRSAGRIASGDHRSGETGRARFPAGPGACQRGHHRAGEEHHLSHGFETDVSVDSKARESSAVAEHQATPIVPSGRQDRGGEGQSLRARPTVQADAAIVTQAAHLCGATDP